MNRKLVLMLTLTLLVGTLNVAFNFRSAKASGTIYIRADGSIDSPDAPISTADNVTYTIADNINDSIVVERDNTAVDGAGYILSVFFPPGGNGITLYDRSNVTIKNLKIQGLWDLGGIELMRSSNCTISGNNITADSPLQPWSLRIDNSSNNKIVNNTFTNNGLSAIFSYQNTVENNTVNGKPLVYLENVSNHSVNDAGQVILVRCNNVTVKDLDLPSTTAGVELFETNNTTISENNITENNLGIMLENSSNNTITANNITRTISGIWLENSSNNTISGSDITGGGHLGVAGISNTGINLRYSNHNSISCNNITNNENGIILEWNSSYDCVYENNITENVYGIGVVGSGDGLEYPNNTICHNNFVNNSIQVRTFYSMNFWDDGYPSGGNYWSNYTGVDMKSGFYQNETGNDGIGDVPHTIDANNIDNYPLMGMFSDLNVTSEYCVQTICNSSISDFKFNVTSISFNVTGQDGAAGFCRICIPTALMNATYRVFVNGTEVQYDVLSCSNSTYGYLYFTYNHSTEQIIIVPEFPSFIFLPLLMSVMLLSVVVYRIVKFEKRCRKGR